MIAKSLPKFIEIKEQLLADIRSGLLVVGEQLPPREELQARFGVSKATLNKALGELIHDGMLAARRNCGTFVAAKSRPPHFAMIARFEASAQSVRANSLLFGPGELKLYLPYNQEYKLEFIEAGDFIAHPEFVSSYDMLFWMIPDETDFDLLRRFPNKLIAINRYGDGFNFISTNHRVAMQDVSARWLRNMNGKFNLYYLDVEDNSFICRERREGFISACEEAGAFYRIVPLCRDFHDNLARLDALHLKNDVANVIVSPSHNVTGAVLAMSRRANLVLGESLFYSDFDFGNAMEITGCEFPSVVQDHAAIAQQVIAAAELLGKGLVQKFIPYHIVGRFSGVRP